MQDVLTNIKTPKPGAELICLNVQCTHSKQMNYHLILVPITPISKKIKTVINLQISTKVDLTP